MDRTHYPAVEGLLAEEVLACKAWAVRRGLPQWLWPDIEIEDWQHALHAIERVTSRILLNGCASDTLDGKLNAIGLAAYTSGLGPLLGYWCLRDQLAAPAAVVATLRHHFEQNTLRMRRLQEHARGVVEQLTGSGIAVTVIKGLHTAFECFPEPGTRPATDIDLFVAPGDKACAGRLLRKLGYAPEHESRTPDEQFWRHRSSMLAPQSLTFVHADDPWGIDLHTSANRRYAQASPIIPFDVLVGRKAKNGWCLHPRAHVMNDYANILFIACHAGCGLANLRMLRLVELVLLIECAQKSATFSWEAFAELGEQTGTLKHAFAALHLTSMLVPSSIPEDILRRTRADVPTAARRLIERLKPATAHTITRCSIEERYMWSDTSLRKVRQAIHDLVPFEMTPAEAVATIARRMRRVIRGTLTIRATEM